MRKKRPVPRTREWHPIAIERDGTVYNGEYRIERVMITVQMMGGGTTTTHQSATGNNEVLAQVILGELVTKEQMKRSRKN